MIKKLFLLLILSLVCTMQATAEKVSEQQALERAQQFLNSGKSQFSRGVNNTPLQLAHTSSSYYVFNRGNDNGFVIVAADDRFDNPVLGFSDKGSFDANNMPENMRWWLGEYDRMLQIAQRDGALRSKQIAQTERAEIAPLVSAKWDQSAPYNDLCPTYNGMRCPTGCLATALAQIVYCNKYPTQGVGSHSYDWTVNLVSQGTLSVDFSQHIYNYDLMSDTYDEASSAESRQAVAQLMYDLGVLAEMAYKPQISSAPTFTTLVRMVEHLKYDKSAIIRSREFYTDKEWIEMIYANLAEGYPLLYTGQNEWQGHAFVCDGYRDGYFHINWGWSGGSNGYFLLDGLEPGSQGIGGSSGGYNDGQEAIFNLKPAQSNSKYEILMYNYNNFDITQKAQTSSSTATFTGNFSNLSIAGQVITLGLKVIDSNGNVTWIQEVTSANINSLAGAESIVVKLSNFPTTNGEYRVYPAYQDENGVWKEMRTKKNFPQNHLMATVSGKNITFATPLRFSDWAPSNEVVAEKEFSMQVTAINNTGNNYSDQVRLALMEYGTSNVIDYSDKVTLSVANGSTATITFTMTAPKEHGFCNCFVINSKGETISEIARFAVEENTETTAEYTLSLQSVEVTQAPNQINITANITCTNGRYNGFIGFYIYPEKGSNFVDYTYTNFYIREGETLSVSNSGEFYGLQEGKNYYAVISYNDAVAGKWTQIGTTEQRQYFTYGDLSAIDEITNDNTPFETSVYNLSGIRLLHFEAGEALDTNTLKPGIYIVKSGNHVKRIIINK